jgi:hypothetical protein
MSNKSQAWKRITKASGFWIGKEGFDRGGIELPNEIDWTKVQQDFLLWPFLPPIQGLLTLAFKANDLIRFGFFSACNFYDIRKMRERPTRINVPDALLLVMEPLDV